jgi:hypothetical protein
MLRTSITAQRNNMKTLRSLLDPIRNSTNLQVFVTMQQYFHSNACLYTAVPSTSLLWYGHYSRSFCLPDSSVFDTRVPLFSSLGRRTGGQIRRSLWLYQLMTTRPIIFHLLLYIHVTAISYTTASALHFQVSVHYKALFWTPLKSFLLNTPLPPTHIPPGQVQASS